MVSLKKYRERRKQSKVCRFLPVSKSLDAATVYTADPSVSIVITVSKVTRVSAIVAQLEGNIFIW